MSEKELGGPRWFAAESNDDTVSQDDAFNTYLHVSSLEALLAGDALDSGLSTPSFAQLPAAEVSNLSLRNGLSWDSSVQPVGLGPCSADAVCDVPQNALLQLAGGAGSNSWTQFLRHGEGTQASLSFMDPPMTPLASPTLPGSGFALSYPPQLGLPAGWAGHRVIALPGEVVSPVTLLVNLDSGQASAHSASSLPGSTLYPLSSSQPMQAHSADSLLHTSSWPAAQFMQLLGGSNPPQLLGGANPPLMLDRTLSGTPHMEGLGRGRGGRGQYGHRGRQIRPSSIIQTPLSPSCPVTVRATAPTWAGADWDPLRNVHKSASGPKSGGTGVFLLGAVIPDKPDGPAVN